MVVAAVVARGPPAALVTPPWHAPFGHSRSAVCVDASAAHGRGQENNTRWTFYAVPGGVPPEGGWPVYLYLLPWPDTPTNTNVTAFGGKL